MSFRRFAITAVIASTTLIGCGNRIPVESPTGDGSTESASQASTTSSDEISSQSDINSPGGSGDGHHEGWERYIATMTDSLGLSNEQVEDLNELYEDYQANVRAAMDSARESGDRSELRTKLKDLRQTFEESFNDVLTEEQQTRLEEIRANAAARRKDRGWENYIAAMTDSLGLSDQQVADLNELYGDYQADVKAAMDSARASGDRSGLRTKLTDLRQTFEESFNDVLTEEQQTRLEEIRANAAARKKDRGWEKYIAAMTDSLGLSDQQVADIDELYEDYQADVKAAIDSVRESGDRSGLRDRLRELKEEFDEDFNDVLSDEQKEKLDEMKSGGRKRSGKGRGHGRKGRSG